jgi:hypothetical protein
LGVQEGQHNVAVARSNCAKTAPPLGSIVMILGLVMSAFGFHAAWLATHRKPNWMA